MMLKHVKFMDCQLDGADFAAADLSESLITNCNLTHAKFEGTQLQKTDLRRSYNYEIDPEKNALQGALFSLEGISGLLSKYQIYIDGA